MGADARPEPGHLGQGQQGARRRAETGSINWLETLLGGRPRRRADLVYRQAQSAPQEVWLVLVDASASTRRHQALSEAKGLLAQFFEQAYQRRVRLAVLTASGQKPQWQLSGSKAAKGLNDWLQALGAGGGTPFLDALQEADVWLKQRKKRCPDELQRLLLLTDGRFKTSSALTAIGCGGVLIDIEKGPIRLGRARQLAAQLAVDYQHIDDLPVQ